MWFSDTVKTSTYGIKKLNYDEEYLKSILLTKLSESDSSKIAKIITAYYYGIIVRWCITNGNDNPIFMIKEFNETELKGLSKKGEENEICNFIKWC